MKYYKLNNEVFAFESDNSQDDYITEDMVMMTDEEIATCKEVWSKPAR